MSEEQTDLVTPNEEVEITPASLDEMKANMDSDGLKKAIERISAGQTKAVETPVKVEDDALEEKGEPKKFVTEVRGKEIAVGDDDNYLGYGKFGRMKKAFVHNREEVKHSYSLIEEAKKAAQEAVKAKLEAEEKLKELEAAKPPVTPLKVEEPKALSVPVVPEYPEALPASSVDWDEGHQELYKRYRSDKNKYDADFSEYVANLKGAGISKEAETRLAEAEAKIAELNAEKEKGDTRLKQEEIDNLNKDYWSNLDSFRNKHKGEFGDSEKTKITDLHDGVVKWIEKFVGAHGIQKPYTPQTTDAPEWIEYRNSEAEIVNKFLSDDPDTVKIAENSEALKPPEGYEEYYRLLNLMQYKEDLVKSGELSEKASLHSAWLIKADKEGYLDKGIGDIQKNAVANAADAVLNTLQKEHKENAINLPNDQFQNPAAATTKADIERILKLSPFELQANPELRALHSKLIQLPNKG